MNTLLSTTKNLVHNVTSVPVQMLPTVSASITTGGSTIVASVPVETLPTVSASITTEGSTLTVINNDPKTIMSIVISTREDLERLTREEVVSASTLVLNPSNQEDHCYFLSVIRELCFLNITSVSSPDFARCNANPDDYSYSELEIFSDIFPAINNLTVTVRPPPPSHLVNIIGEGDSSVVVKRPSIDVNYLTHLTGLRNLNFQVESDRSIRVGGIWMLVNTSLSNILIGGSGSGTAYFTFQIPDVVHIEDAPANHSVISLVIANVFLEGNYQHLCLYKALRNLSILSKGSVTELGFIGQYPALDNLALLDNNYTNLEGAIPPSLSSLTVVSNVDLVFDGIQKATHLKSLVIGGVIRWEEVEKLRSWGFSPDLSGATVV